MKKNKKNSKKTVYLLLLLVLGISVGYAALSATLKINGTSIIKSAKWSVHFKDNIQVTNGSVTGANVTKAAAIKENTDNTEIEFSVTLPEPGDFYEFTVDVVNDGTLDAVIDTDGVSLDVTATDSSNDTVAAATYNKYFTYEIIWTDETRTDKTPAAGDKLLAPTDPATEVTKPLKVRVYYDKDKVNTDEDLPKKDVTFNIDFSMNYVQDK